ncbi:FadD3 family acyl-CoA ligase [Marinobacterium sediminicola]|uniref:Acyl-CoA synthetase (AMP-forming)/AMP-acid ligase II n=1 Tax=Marinobacterium sediminicola TaxID=518898 RepID=A0ABY1S459_9GAMM|nr:FadD3 family acyl-CoA ligase [Marinobacterium sediminicola]ULG70143.1 FadD3 family acyl-CoA ligase [Marinobacterium sediminicola]SMR78418.1 Acyl-CoA synthetase (AMP-forming)/AMP-acid ligase II [Marinobacterium sediminicola]
MTSMQTQLDIPLQAQTIPELVFEASRRFAGRAAIEDGGEVIDYADLSSRALEVARGLMRLGVQAGDRVAVWAPNGARWVLATLGLQMAGAILVPINTRMKAAEACDIITRSGSRILFSVGDFLDTDYPAMIADSCGDWLEMTIVMSERKGQPLANSLDWDSFIEHGQGVTESAARVRASELTADSLSDLMFTSGTTGKPKGVMSAHGAALRAFSEFVRILTLKPGDRFLIVNPFFHTFGYKAGWLSCLLSGATILPHPVFDADEVLARIENDKVSVLPGPPTLYLSLLAHPELNRKDLSSLRVASTGASTIPPVLIERMRNELGFDVVTTAYGLTECGGLATICDPNDPAETIAGTSGKAIPGTEVAILDKDGNRLAANESGEICIRGFHVMQGYFQNPEATAETIDADKWLHTGDIGTLDENGYLRITGRLKDMFIVGGFNCYPAEIEAALVEHPEVAQAAVIGVPDERMGEVGCAFIVRRHGSQLDEKGLIQWSRAHMANYKVPRMVRFVSALPVNASNKVDKLALKRDFEGA